MDRLEDPGLTADLDAVAALAGKIRRDLYDFVASAAAPVSRDEAAEAMGLGRQAVAYHLDQLVDQGLLEIEFKRLTGKVGPGAGRPSKLYRVSPRSIEVSVPPRRYELASRILLQAVASSPSERQAVAQAAHQAGAQIGLLGLEAALRATGYRPVSDGGVTRFRNCPFDALQRQNRVTACEMNLALVQGILESSGAKFEAEPEPEAGYCCVRLRPSAQKVKEDTA